MATCVPVNTFPCISRPSGKFTILRPLYLAPCAIGASFNVLLSQLRLSCFFLYLPLPWVPQPQHRPCIYVFDTNYSGAIPPEIGRLSSLTVLSLWNNKLTGETGFAHTAIFVPFHQFVWIFLLFRDGLWLSPSRCNVDVFRPRGLELGWLPRAQVQ